MIILISVITLAVFAYIFWKYKFKNNESLSFSVMNVETLNQKLIVDWFKKEENINRLKSDDNLIAVSIKGEDKPNDVINNLIVPKGSYLVCLFNEASNEVIDGLIFKPNSISEDVIDMFKDKDMVILS